MYRTYREEFDLDSMEDLKPNPSSLHKGFFEDKKTEAFIMDEIGE